MIFIIAAIGLLAITGLICLSPFRLGDKKIFGILSTYFFSVVTMVTLPLYWQLGSFGFADHPAQGKQENSFTMPVLDQAMVNVFSTLGEEDRSLQIKGMVQSLSSRLSEEGGTAQEWARLGNAYQILNDFTAAEKAFAQAAILEPQNPQWFVLQARSAWQIERVDLVIQALKQALTLEPNHSEALWLTGQLALHYQDKKQAEIYFRLALANVPKNTPMHRLLESEIDKMLQREKSG